MRMKKSACKTCHSILQFDQEGRLSVQSVQLLETAVLLT